MSRLVLVFLRILVPFSIGFFINFVIRFFASGLETLQEGESQREDLIGGSTFDDFSDIELDYDHSVKKTDGSSEQYGI